MLIFNFSFSFFIQNNINCVGYSNLWLHDSRDLTKLLSLSVGYDLSNHVMLCSLVLPLQFCFFLNKKRLTIFNSCYLFLIYM